MALTSINECDVIQIGTSTTQSVVPRDQVPMVYRRQRLHRNYETMWTIPMQRVMAILLRLVYCTAAHTDVSFRNVGPNVHEPSRPGPWPKTMIFGNGPLCSLQH
jgi:hypothetical protein